MAATQTPAVEPGPASAATGVAARRRARAGRVLAAAVLVAVGYLAVTFLNPRVVPRLAVLPAPEGRVWFDTCNGAPGNRHSESWQRSGGFWIRSEFSTLGGCIDEPPPG